MRTLIRRLAVHSRAHSLLPITLLLYKIQRDDNRLQKFGSGLESVVDMLAGSVGE
jgi:hypothetical protein